MIYIDKILEDLNNKKESQRQAYDLVIDSSKKQRTKSLERQQYINHLTVQVRKEMHEARKMAEEVEKLLKQVTPLGSQGNNC